MVWIAGPLSGLIMQPIVFLYWAGQLKLLESLLKIRKELVTVKVQIFDAAETMQKSFWTLALAISSIYAVDFAINAGKSQTICTASTR